MLDSAKPVYSRAELKRLTAQTRRGSPPGVNDSCLVGSVLDNPAAHLHAASGRKLC